MGAHYSGHAPRTTNVFGIVRVLLWTALAAVVLFRLVRAGGAELGAAVTNWFNRL